MTYFGNTETRDVPDPDSLGAQMPQAVGQPAIQKPRRDGRDRAVADVPDEGHVRLNGQLGTAEEIGVQFGGDARDRRGFFLNDPARVPRRCRAGHARTLRGALLRHEI
jgi:hypothetical protein